MSVSEGDLTCTLFSSSMCSTSRHLTPAFISWLWCCRETSHCVKHTAWKILKVLHLSFHYQPVINWHQVMTWNVWHPSAKAHHLEPKEGTKNLSRAKHVFQKNMASWMLDSFSPLVKSVTADKRRPNELLDKLAVPNPPRPSSQRWYITRFLLWNWECHVSSVCQYGFQVCTCKPVMQSCLLVLWCESGNATSRQCHNFSCRSTY